MGGVDASVRQGWRPSDVFDLRDTACEKALNALQDAPGRTRRFIRTRPEGSMVRSPRASARRLQLLLWREERAWLGSLSIPPADLGRLIGIRLLSRGADGNGSSWQQRVAMRPRSLARGHCGQIAHGPAQPDRPDEARCSTLLANASRCSVHQSALLVHARDRTVMRAMSSLLMR